MGRMVPISLWLQRIAKVRHLFAVQHCFIACHILQLPAENARHEEQASKPDRTVTALCVLHRRLRCQSSSLTLA
jgi:hypothetical protein